MTRRTTGINDLNVKFGAISGVKFSAMIILDFYGYFYNG